MSATAVESAGVITLTGAAGEIAIAQSVVTTTDEDTLVSYAFTVGDNIVTLRVGSTAGGQEIVQDSVFLPGYHVVSFTPGVTTYYVQFLLSGVGIATVSGFARIAPGALTLITPYAAENMADTRFDQSNNTMFFANPATDTQVLERRGQYSFSFRPFLQLDGPFASLNQSNITLTPSGRTGRITITASTALFTTMDEGGLLRLTHTGQFETADLSSVDAVTDAIRVTGVSSSRVFNVQVTGTWSGTVVLERSVGNEFSYETYAVYVSNQNANVDDDLDNQIIYYRLRMSGYASGAATATLTYAQGYTDGIARIVTVDADNQVTADVVEPFGKLIATALWARGAWSAVYGYPEAVTLYDGRLWFGRGNEYFGSAADDYSSFAVGALPDEAMYRTFTGRMSRVRWMRGASSLMAGLAGFESEIGSNALDDVIVPDNVRSKAVQSKGSAPADPVLVGEGPVYISRSRKRLYHLLSSETGRTMARDLTRLNRDIAGEGGFSQIAYQLEPEPRIWSVRADGQVAILVYDEDEQVMAWCRMVVDGHVESVCCLPGTPEDQVYFIIRRTINGSTVRYIEQLAAEAWDTVQEANRLHCSLTYSGSETSSLSGLGHLEGRDDVYVWANGQQAGPFTVSSGAIADVGFSFTYAIAGLLYDATYKSGRLNWGAAMGSGLATYKQIEKAGLILHQTAGGAVSWGSDPDDMETLPDRKTEDGETLAFDSAVQLWSEDLEEDVFSWTERDTRLYIKMSTAGPATVLGIATTLKTNG